MSNYYPDGLYQHILDSPFHDAQPQYYQGQIPRLQIDTPELPQSWDPSQRPRSVQNTRDQVHIRATSVHAAQNTPGILMSDRMGYLHPDLPRTNNRPIVSQQNSLHMFPPNDVSPTINPSAREDPWSLFHTRNGENSKIRYPSGQSNTEFPQYPRVGSDVGSSILPSDSGYMSSFGASQSVHGDDSERAAQPLSMAFINQIGSMNVESTAGSVTAASCVPSDQRSHVGSTRSRKATRQPIKCDHAGCTEEFKCESEYKKHKRKHDKPYRCEEPDCKRALEGFTTSNDLDRHKKTVHQIDIRKKSYKCVGKNCRNKEKVWPRLDNFKQHIERMHPNEDTADVIERSKLGSEKQPSFASDESAVAHMGASLVLDDVDKSLPSYPATASSSPLEPSLKRDQQDCASFDWSPGAIKEEHKRSHFPDHTSSTAQPAHRERHHTQIRAPGLSSAKQTQLPLPSDVSMDPPPRRAISKAPQSNMGYGLSNAPQTKAEQQRMSRKRSVAAPSLTDPADINHILSVLQRANASAKRDNISAGTSPSTPADSDAVILTKRDALEIAKLLEAAQGVPRRTDRGVAPRQRTCPHSDCNRVTTRACDMRKHLKRHKKPYGCTYSMCYKRFGAKSDWKRHENNQHFQTEAFRCAFEKSSGAVCGIYLHRLEMFEDHLKAHRITASQMSEDLTRRSKIGKNCQETFWCGFCKAIIQLKTRRNAAWDERFDHIAHHLEKEEKSIEEWVCVEQNRTKKELEEESKRDALGFEDDRDKDDDSESVGEDEDGEGPLPQVPALPTPSAPMTCTPMQQPSPLSFSPGSSRKREAPGGTDHIDRRSREKRRKTYYTSTYCCSCETGPCGAMQVSCIECGHVLCQNCIECDEEFIVAGAMDK